MTKEILLELKDIRVRYGGVTALDGASVALDEGEIVALMGPNGAGKSTILKALFGLAPIESGEIRWEGKAIWPVSHEVVQRGVAFVPQGRRIFTRLSVQENMEIGGFGLSRSVIKERMAGALTIFPALKPRLSSAAGTLSGGQQQQLALARGLMQDPKVFLLDEPSLGLSPMLVTEVFAKIKEINERRKTAIMIVEHNIRSVLRIAHRGYVLDKGAVAFEGSAQSITESGILEKVFVR